MATVLALDKDPLQLELISLLLRRDRHRVLTTSDPDNAVAMARSEAFDLAIVETALPHHDGYRICGELLSSRPDVSLMIASESCAENDVVRGLLAGADDYIRKPYSPREFLARVHAVLRRAARNRRSAVMPTHPSIGEITLDRSQLQAVINGRPVPLSPREFSVLYTLMSEANRVLTREQITRLAWGDNFVGPKAVDVCVQRIRKKMQPYLLSGSYVLAIRGYGYKFAKPIVAYGSQGDDHVDLVSAEMSASG